MERMLHAQRLRLTELHGVQVEFQAMVAHFSTQPSKHGGSAAIGNCCVEEEEEEEEEELGKGILYPLTFSSSAKMFLVLFLMVNCPRPSVASK